MNAPTTSSDSPLVYEETPIITPIVDPPAEESSVRKNQQPPSHSVPPPSPIPSGRRVLRPVVRDILIFLILFAVGVVGSSVIRPSIGSLSLPDIASLMPHKQAVKPKESTALPYPTLPTSPSPAENTTWENRTFTANGITVTYRLPNGVIAPSCDGGGCPSEGTYLPGGTRFTLSTKKTAPIANFEKLIVNDAAGRAFEMKEATVAGRVAVSFSGSFTGSTTGGYTFTRMHGVMVEVEPTVTLELNHFAPNGITADFETDDSLFSAILSTVAIQTGNASPTSSPATLSQ